VHGRLRPGKSGRVVRGLVRTGQTCSRSALLLRRAGTSGTARCKRTGLRGPGERPNRRYRYGARAFSTREGYASRNRETELAFPPEHQGGDVRPPSRFSSEMGRVQTRSSRWASVFCPAENAVQNQDSPGARAAVGVSGFRVSRKEFWFAYF
jgi:hypothetical protein